MSYLPIIQPCKFINYPNEGVSYGYRCYDSYESSYNNTWKEEDMKKLPLQVLKKVIYDKSILHDDNLEHILNQVKKEKSSIEIGDCILNWQSIKDTMSKI